MVIALPDILKIGVIRGDGIGPDIVDATVSVVTAAAERVGEAIEWVPLPGGLSALETHGSTFPQVSFRAIANLNGLVLGPVSHHLYPGDDPQYINPSGFLRKRLDLYANLRPVRYFPGVPALHTNVDLLIVRENTEGMYADRNVLDGNGELRINEDTIVSVRVVTRQAIEKLLRTAFDMARKRNGKKLVTVVHKANVLKRGDGLVLRCAEELAQEYPDVAWNEAHVDAFAMQLVMKPEEVDVVATTNMFGDILSDEAAGLVGGLGMAPGLNAGDHFAMAQAAHGSAPDIADSHTANPVAEIMSGAMLLQWLALRHKRGKLEKAARLVETAISTVLSEARVVTPDLGGTVTTPIMASAITDALGR